MRAEKILAGEDQSLVGEIVRSSSLNEKLSSLMRMRARVLIALRGRDHETAQQVGMLLDLARAGDDRGLIVIGNAKRCNGEDVKLEAGSLGLNDLPALEYPGKIDLLCLQSLHGVDIQRHVLENALAAGLANDRADHRRLVGRAEAAVDLAIQVAGTVQAGAGQRDQRG